jgi:predicted MPP superfamily phosphohydrolase
MYLLTEMILFFPLIVYACIRVGKLIPRSDVRHIFISLYVFLFLGYPLAELISHRQASDWARPLVICGYYCLPYLLYIVLSVVAIDLAVALARSLKLVHRETVSGSIFRFVRLGLYVTIPALIVAGGAWNNNRLQVKNLSVGLQQKNSRIESLHVVFASDFHLSQITNDHLVERFVAKVNALNPDIVLMGGDVVEGDRDENLNNFEAQFRKIRSKYGVYAARGNHESHRGVSDALFARCGMKFLEDSIQKIDGAFYLVVRKNARFSRRKPISELLKEAPENLPIILLDHSPTDLEDVSKSRVDLQFSGHTHNGQLFPVNLLVMPFQYELAWGTMVKRHTVFVVSSGVQAWGPPVKTAGDSEILSVKINFAASREKVGPIRDLFAATN